MRPNTLLIRWAKGWTEDQDGTDPGETGRREALLTLGAVSSITEAWRVADAQLAEFARERVETTVGVEPSGPDDTPYLAFDVGDTITLEGEEHRVLGMTVSRDPQTGRALFVPSLNDDVVLDPDERIAQALRKMVNGTLGGRAKVAQPVVAPRRAPGTSGGSSNLWQYAGGTLSPRSGPRQLLVEAEVDATITSGDTLLVESHNSLDIKADAGDAVINIDADDGDGTGEARIHGADTAQMHTDGGANVLLSGGTTEIDGDQINHTADGINDIATVVHQMNNVSFSDQASASGPVGSVVGKIQVLDAGGSVVGYLPVYGSIT